MFIQNWLIIISFVSMLALFISLRRVVPLEKRKIALIYFLNGIWVLIFVFFNILNSQYKYLNSTPRLIATIVIFIGVGYVIYRFEQKYKKELPGTK